MISKKITSMLVVIVMIITSLSTFVFAKPNSGSTSNPYYKNDAKISKDLERHGIKGELKTYKIEPLKEIVDNEKLITDKDNYPICTAKLSKDMKILEIKSPKKNVAAVITTTNNDIKYHYGWDYGFFMEKINNKLIRSCQPIECIVIKYVKVEQPTQSITATPCSTETPTSTTTPCPTETTCTQTIGQSISPSVAPSVAPSVVPTNSGTLPKTGQSSNTIFIVLGVGLILLGIGSLAFYKFKFSK